MNTPSNPGEAPNMELWNTQQNMGLRFPSVSFRSDPPKGVRHTMRQNYQRALSGVFWGQWVTPVKV